MLSASVIVTLGPTFNSKTVRSFNNCNNNTQVSNALIVPCRNPPAIGQSVEQP